jgi:hypothetical protein
MTLAHAISRVRRHSRTDSTGKSDAEIVDAINEAQKAWGKDVYDMVKEGYLTVAPMFDTATNFAIRLTITGGTDALAAGDIAITGTARTDVTGTQVATDLQTTIQAAGATNTTVAWSTTTWKFTITAPADTTSVTLAAPSGITYINALPLLGLDADTTVGYVITDSIPTDCTVETDLPSDFIRILSPVEWNDRPLAEGHWSMFASPQHSGKPSLYAIRDKKIRLYPYPTSQEKFHIWYTYLPTTFATGYQEVGLSAMTGGGASGLAASTQYYYKVNVNGNGVVEYSITTGSDVTNTAVVALMNANTHSCTWAIVDGDLRCTSDVFATTSTIALAAGTTGTDLFATLTGWSAFDTAVVGTGSPDINIDDEDAMGIVYYAASLVSEENERDRLADRMMARYLRLVGKHRIRRANTNTAVFPGESSYIPYEVV